MSNYEKIYETTIENFKEHLSKSKKKYGKDCNCYLKTKWKCSYSIYKKDLKKHKKTKGLFDYLRTKGIWLDYLWLCKGDDIWDF